MDSFLNMDTKQDTVSKAKGETTTAKSASGVDTTIHEMDSSSQTSVSDPETNIEITDMASVQKALGQILKAVKPISNMNSQIDNLVLDVRRFEKSLSDQKQRIDNLQASVDFNDKTIKDFKDKIEPIVKNQVTRDQMTAMELAFAKENVELRRHIIKLEEYSRRNNLMFHGIPEKENEQCVDEIMSFLVDKLGIMDAQSRIIINKAHRIGQRKAAPPRPIIVQFIYSA